MSSGDRTGPPSGPEQPAKLKSRDRILQAAFDLFVQKGYAGTSTREIAEKAGVNEVTLFRIFKTKANLFSEATQKQGKMPPVEMLSEHIRKFSFEEGLRFLITTTLERTVEDAAVVRFRILEGARQKDPELRERNAQMPMRIRGIFVEHLRRGVREGYVDGSLNLELAAQLVLFINLACAFMAPMMGTPMFSFEPKDVAEILTRFMLKGLAPEKAA